MNSGKKSGNPERIPEIRKEFRKSGKKSGNPEFRKLVYFLPKIMICLNQ